MIKKKTFKINLKYLKHLDQKGLGAIPRFFMSALIVLTLFYTTPIMINSFKNKSNEFKNNSKAVLAYTLNNYNFKQR